MGNEAEILLVEDNPGDQRLTVEALRKAEWAGKTYVVQDGAEALGFLRRVGRYAGSPRPDLIILDLNLPGEISGPDVLAQVKRDPELRQIPVVVLTSSDRGHDVSRSYSLGADCFVTKPHQLDGFYRMTERFQECWLIAQSRSRRSIRVQAREAITRLKRRANTEKADYYWMLLVVFVLLLVVALLFA